MAEPVDILKDHFTEALKQLQVILFLGAGYGVISSFLHTGIQSKYFLLGIFVVQSVCPSSSGTTSFRRQKAIMESDLADMTGMQVERGSDKSVN